MSLDRDVAVEISALTASQLVGAEDEAEATAYLVAKRMNLKAYSARYLRAYMDRQDKAPFSLDAILVAAGKIEPMCAGTLRR